MHIHILITIFIIILPVLMILQKEKEELQFLNIDKSEYYFKDIFSNNHNNIIVFAITLIMTLVSSLRSFSVGTDLSRYIDRFTRISTTPFIKLENLSDVYNTEIGFILVNKIISLFTENPRVFVVVISIVINVFVALYIKKNSGIPWLSFYFYITLSYWAASMSVLRQFIAILFLFKSIEYIQKNRFKGFFICIILAFFFHKSAIIFIIIYPLSKIKISKAYLFFSMIIAFFIHFFGMSILSYASMIFGYERYLEKYSGGGGKGMFLMLSFFLLVALFVRWKYKSNEQDVYIHILIFAVILNVFAFKLSLTGRLMLFFSIHNIILLPNIIRLIESRKLQVIITTILMAGTAYYYFYNYLVVNNSNVIPFNFL